MGTSSKLALDLFLLLMDGRREKERWVEEEEEGWCGDSDLLL